MILPETHHRSDHLVHLAALLSVLQLRGLGVASGGSQPWIWSDYHAGFHSRYQNIPITGQGNGSACLHGLYASDGASNILAKKRVVL